ncbi:conserved protein of unknown function [Tenacibaculum sp. 190524A02b]|uniref:hypothetical protein n=1 Tax=Tenacibaculum vairaonense TaxID=3137860 RepID=UPI0032B21572
MNSYDLSRKWFNFSFENPDLVKPIHTAIYFIAIDTCNRLGWKEKFSLCTYRSMEGIGVKSPKTYKKALLNLVEWGFLIMYQESKNQHTANIVALVKNTKADTQADTKALDKALLNQEPKQELKQSPGTDKLNATIIKQINNKTINNKQQTKGEEDFKNMLYDFFSLKTEDQKIKASGFFRGLEKTEKFENFKIQTEAYIEFKKESKEKIHGWWSYQACWMEVDWQDKLKKLKESERGESVMSLKNKKLNEKLAAYGG